MTELDRLPVVGDELVAGSIRLAVRAMDGHRIIRIEVEEVDRTAEKDRIRPARRRTDGGVRAMTAADLCLWGPLMLLGFAGSAYFSGVETGVYTLNRVRLHLLDARGLPAAVRLRKRRWTSPLGLLATLLIGNNATNYLGTFSLAVLLEAAGVIGWKAVVLNVGLVTPLLFVLGETLPKDLFAAHGDRLLYPLSGSIRFFERLFTWTGGVPLVNAFGRVALRLVGGESEAGVRHPRRQVQSLVREGLGQGVLTGEQSDLLERVFRAEGSTVRGEATPWADVVTAGPGDTVAVLRERAGSTSRSHLPIVNEAGRVTGWVDLFEVLRSDPAAGVKLAELRRSIPFLSPDVTVYAAIERFQERRWTIAVVGTAEQPLGVVTMKDLVEPVTGELLRW